MLRKRVLVGVIVLLLTMTLVLAIDRYSEVNIAGPVGPWYLTP